MLVCPRNAFLHAMQIDKRSLEVQAAEVVRARIVSGELPAGERLTEARLSDELVLSRGTVRAALLRLANEGLVAQVPYAGWSVVTLTARDAWELYTLRSSLEALAAQLAAASMVEGSEAPLKAAFQHLKEACDSHGIQRIADADFALHKHIIDISGHQRLKQQYSALEQQVRMYIASSDALLRTSEDVMLQHVPLVDAILARDAERAGRIERDHNLSEGQALVDHFRRIEHPNDAGSRPLMSLGGAWALQGAAGTSHRPEGGTG